VIKYRRVIMEANGEGEASSHPHHARLVPLAVGALGVVFGDIGTSPLYTLQMAGAEASAPADILGVLSLIFWGLTVVIAVKYLTFIMRADNRGEGGILALLALIPETTKRLTWITLMVVAGAALLFGDGIITPAISVLSAIEGLRLAAPDAFSLGTVVAITIAILVGLFAIQSRGTGAIGRLFGPVMIAWFATIGVLGLAQIVQHPGVLRALSPVYGVQYFVRHGWHGFPILGVVVLCLTGGEALYADMGHFGARPIRVAWLVLAMPALVLCYFGQGALMLFDRSALANPFFALVPLGGWTYALVILSALATIIASQALITGVYSLTHQAVQLGLFPRVTIRHTSAHAEGQIYVPVMNWGLAIACCLLVVFFQESSRLAAAYGIAVSGTMAITSITYYLVTRRTWQWTLWKALPLLVLFLAFDLPFFAANLMKFVDGGYVPVIVGAVFFVIMVMWRMGRTALVDYTRSHSTPQDQFLATVDQRCATRVPGTAIFMSSLVTDIPLILEHHIRRIHVLHERIVLLTIVFAHQPYIALAERLEITELGKGFVRIIARFGFMDQPDIPALLATAKHDALVELSLGDATYYLGRETFLSTSKGKLGPIREGVFAFLSRNSANAMSYFGIPPHQVVELGTQIDL
jgi:KUP system potassium uptake protein